jgi:O-antigen/teichoic acid export membrane protein
MIVRTGVYAASNLAMVLAAWAGLGLVALAVLILAASVASAVITYTQAQRRVRWFGVARPTRDQVRKFFNFSGWVLIWSLVSKFLLSSDLLLLGYLIGPQAVTNFIFTSYFAQFAVSVCFMTAGSLMPGVGSLMSSGNEARFNQAVAGIREVIIFIAVVLCAGILLFNQVFVTLWAGNARYMGPLVNALIVMESFQLILVRNEAQLQDLTLAIGRKVVMGLAATLLSIGAAYALYRSTNEIWTIFAGIIGGRMVLSLSFPRMVNQMLPGNQASRAPRLLLAFGALIICAVAENWTANFGLVESMIVKLLVFGGVSLFAFVAILEKDSRIRLMSLLRFK